METGSLLSEAAPTGVATRSRSASKSNNGPSIVPAVTATVSNPLSIPHSAKSPARAIPQATEPSHHQHPTQQQNQQQQSSQSGSHDSSGSAFLSGIMNPSAATTFSSTNAQLSHTPPTAFGTSYENNHFGKRQRSGVSAAQCSQCCFGGFGLIDQWIEQKIFQI